MKKPKPFITTDHDKGQGMRELEMTKEEPTCEHGTAWDVHCCGCHSGFLFDPNHKCETDDGN